MNKPNTDMSEWECTLIKKLHDQDMSNPAYREGFESDSSDSLTNPYIFPEALADERLAIACKKGALTVEEKEKLFQLGKEFDATDWNMWSKGFYRKYLFKEKV